VGQQLAWPQSPLPRSVPAGLPQRIPDRRGCHIDDQLLLAKRVRGSGPLPLRGYRETSVAPGQRAHSPGYSATACPRELAYLYGPGS
jgi:hypothetical protein